MIVSNLIQNPAILINVALWIIGLILATVTGQWGWIFLIFYVFIFNDFILYPLTGADIYLPSWRTELFYSGGSVLELCSDDLLAVHSNYTEGYYKNSHQCSSPQQSEMDRFDHFIEILGLRAGDRVLDAGCGFGGFVNYLRKKGFDAYGITITKTQYENCKVIHGPYFYYGDYSVFNEDLVGKFDAIIAPGSLEHPFGGHPGMINSYENKYQKMKNMFEMWKCYFDPSSRLKKILTTTLHMNLSYGRTWQYFVMERAYGGLYPLRGSELSVSGAMNAAGYRVLLDKDYSWHYYRASECDRTHFGNPIDIGMSLPFLGGLLYPHIWYIYIYALHGYWMWQWDGRNHYKGNEDLHFEPDPSKRPASLMYTICEMEDSSVH